MREISVRRLVSALAIVTLIVLGGGVTVWGLGEGRYTLFESIYFALYTVATVGFGELPDMENNLQVRVVNAMMIVAGIGAIAFFQSTLTALLVEGVIGRAFRRRRMDRKIDKLEGHFVVCGCGRTGKFVVEELDTVARAFVAIDRDERLLERLSEELGGKLLYVVGDATDDHTLIEAGVQRAAGVVAALSDDRDNLFVTLSARTLNPKARIVSKNVELENEPKILRAGADAIVSLNRMGGMRLVSELVRPKVTAFLDNMLTVAKNLRFEEVEIPKESPWVGRTLRNVPIRDRTNLLVVALHLADNSYVYNPSPDHALAAGTQLIVMGESDSVEKLKKLIRTFPA
jgi:voltage-gated potassium channel